MAESLEIQDDFGDPLDKGLFAIYSSFQVETAFAKSFKSNGEFADTMGVWEISQNPVPYNNESHVSFVLSLTDSTEFKGVTPSFTFSDFGFDFPMCEDGGIAQCHVMSIEAVMAFSSSSDEMTWSDASIRIVGDFDNALAENLAKKEEDENWPLLDSPPRVYSDEISSGNLWGYGEIDLHSLRSPDFGISLSAYGRNSDGRRCSYSPCTGACEIRMIELHVTVLMYTNYGFLLPVLGCILLPLLCILFCVCCCCCCRGKKKSLKKTNSIALTMPEGVLELSVPEASEDTHDGDILYGAMPAKPDEKLVETEAEYGMMPPPPSAQGSNYGMMPEPGTNVIPEKFGNQSDNSSNYGAMPVPAGSKTTMEIGSPTPEAEGSSIYGAMPATGQTPDGNYGIMPAPTSQDSSDYGTMPSNF